VTRDDSRNYRRVFPGQQTAPNYGYLFEVSAVNRDHLRRIDPLAAHTKCPLRSDCDPNYLRCSE
jgi:hypothetical protein